MATVRRILKWMSAATLALSVAAWIMSVFFVIGGRGSTGLDDWRVFLAGGGLRLDYSPSPAPVTYVVHQRNARMRYPDHVVGHFYFHTDRGPAGVGFAIEIPLLTIVTLIAPLALGAFTGFRFRLWHWLAYSGFVAIQLGYQSQAEQFPFQTRELSWMAAFLATFLALLVYLDRLWRRKPT